MAKKRPDPKKALKAIRQAAQRGLTLPTPAMGHQERLLHRMVHAVAHNPPPQGSPVHQAAGSLFPIVEGPMTQRSLEFYRFLRDNPVTLETRIEVGMGILWAGEESISQALQAEERQGHHNACHPGCFWCCHQAVECSIPEGRV